MDKLSIDKCRKILEANGNKYTDHQVILLRDKLYELAEIDYSEFKRRQKEMASDSENREIPKVTRDICT